MNTALQANKMDIISGSMAMPNGLMFTVGQITWTTGSNDFIAMIMKEARIQSASTTASPSSAMAPTTVDLAPTMMDLALTMSALPFATSATCRPLPRYKGKQIDNTDLLDSIDRVGTKLAETLALVSSIQSQPNEQVTAPHNRSTRPARTSRPA